MQNSNETKRNVLFNAANVKCFCCGKMVPDEGYKAKVEGEQKLFCTKECYDFSIVYKKFREGGKL